MELFMGWVVSMRKRERKVKTRVEEMALRLNWAFQDEHNKTDENGVILAMVLLVASDGIKLA